MNFSQDMCNDGIMLEPRLMEYINKFKFFQENDIDQTVSLEKQYSITSDDKRRVKKYLRGKRDLYTRNKLSKDKHFIDTSEAEFETDNDFKKDPRYLRLQKKMQRQRDAQRYRHNYDNMYDNYEMYRKETPYDFMDGSVGPGEESHYNNSAKKSSLTKNRTKQRGNTNHRRQHNQYHKDSYMIDTNDEQYLYDNPNYLSNRHRNSGMTYHVEPKLSYNNRLINTQLGSRRSSSLPHEPSVDKIIGEVDSYRELVGRSSYSHTSDMDFQTKNVLPKMGHNGKRGHKNEYQSIPQMYSGGLRDIDMDNFVRYGVNSRAAKSVGYENPVEHYFNYIDDDMQNPEHVVNQRGLPSRSYNRRTARPYKRDIM